MASGRKVRAWIAIYQSSRIARAEQKTMTPTPVQNLPLSHAITIAAQAITEVMSGRSLTQVLEELEPQERPIVQSLTFDALRRWTRSHALIQQFVPKPPAKEVEHVLAVAITLLLDRTAVSKKGYATHTIVNESVKACGEYDETIYAKGLMNAVLRKVSAALDAQGALRPDHNSPGESYFPPWWIANLRKNYPKSWQAICLQQSQRPPLIVRVNRRANSRDDYAAVLAAAQIEADPVTQVADIALNSALAIKEPIPVSSIPGFFDGLVSIQDAGAQLAATLLQPVEGERILDMCAAPGGKAAHLLECADINLVAIDVDRERLKRVSETLNRLQLTSGRAQKVELIAADAAQLDWWDKTPFDKIVIDAPCSASGIVSRHPDIPFLRRASDVLELQGRQRSLLEAGWQVLKEGGSLLYITCSIFPEEGKDQADWFLREHQNAVRLDAPGQILPSQTHDGFYYALFKKNGP
jgi:16S rRNA (cytosine967-C5)-methyltransferase